MPVKSSFSEMRLSRLADMIAPFAKSPEAEKGLTKMLNYNIVSLGQGGGRKGAELARFGWDIWMVNSATVDMEEHDWIDRKIFLSDPDRGKLEGTAKNAAIGYEIAQKNVDQFKQIAVDTQEADVVIVTVALGGGQGNGAIPVALDWLIKVRELGERKTDKGNPTIIVLASIPPRDESNPNIWLNVISGIKKLQEYIDNKQIGNVYPIDNEFIRHFYENVRKSGAPVAYSALDYSNMIVARSFFELNTIPLLPGQVSMDTTELMEIITTPGWASVNRNTFKYEKKDINVENEILNLFGSNELFAKLDTSNALAAGVAVITPREKSLDPHVIDQIKPTANRILGRPSVLHSAVINSSALSDESYIYGIAVTPSLPDSLIDSIVQKYEEEKERKSKREQSAAKASKILSEVEDVYVQARTTSRKKTVTLDELEIAAKPKKKKISIDEL